MCVSRDAWRIKFWICGQVRLWIWWSFLHKACWRACWPLRWVLQRQAQMTQSLGSGQGNRGEAGGSRTNTQLETNACTHPLLAWWILEWGWKEGKHLAGLGFFYLCCKASVPLWRSGSWSVGSPLLFPPVSSLAHSSPGQNPFLQNKSCTPGFSPFKSFWRQHSTDFSCLCVAVSSILSPRVVLVIQT